MWRKKSFWFNLFFAGKDNYHVFFLTFKLPHVLQEKRMSRAVDVMVHHVENLRRVHEREHAELEEAR